MNPAEVFPPEGVSIMTQKIAAHRVSDAAHQDMKNILSTILDV
jgi:hypothetical protein